jgi:hypothetical protein
MIAVQKERGADADGKAVDGGNQRLLIARQGVEKADGDRFESALGPLLKIADIAAGAERSGAARDHEAADRAVALRVAERSRHRGVHRLRQRVFLFRAVHPDDANAVMIGHENWVGHCCLTVKRRRPERAGAPGHYYRGVAGRR